jgi:hypothetical protein
MQITGNGCPPDGRSDTVAAAGAVTFARKGDLSTSNAHRVKLVKPRERGDRRDERAEWHGSIGIGSVIVEVDRGARTRLREVHRADGAHAGARWPARSADAGGDASLPVSAGGCPVFEAQVDGLDPALLRLAGRRIAIRARRPQGAPPSSSGGLTDPDPSRAPRERVQGEERRGSL